MSKPAADLFPESAGDLAFRGNAEAVIAERTVGLDLNPHPTAMTHLTPKQRREIKRRIANRTATREDFKRFEWDRRFHNRRRRGVRAFWKSERDRILHGQTPTRNWTPKQKEDILAGKVPKFEGKPMPAHHSFSALLYPHLADRKEVMYPATQFEHLHGWHGGSYKNSLPGKRFKPINQII